MKFTKDRPTVPGWYAYGSKKGSHPLKLKGYMKVAIAPDGVILHEVPGQILSNGVVLTRWAEWSQKQGENTHWKGPLEDGGVMPRQPIHPRFLPGEQRGDNPLFDPPAPHQRHSTTSLKAAEAIQPVTGNQRKAVLAYLAQRGAAGATDQEIADGLGMDPSTVRPRRGELAKKGRIEKARDGGELVKRRTRSGRLAQVWRVA